MAGKPMPDLSSVLLKIPDEYKRLAALGIGSFGSSPGL